MIFPILTLLSAFSLAAVAAWFSIIGIMTIYAAAPMYAIVMGVVSECSKLVTASWLYRNWGHASWSLKAPLLGFLATLMMITSIGVFGFLSKAHLDQASSSLDTAPRIEQLANQIAKEEEIIADNDKVIAQLDQTVDTLTQAQRIRGRDGSIAVRQSQAAQRQQLRDDSAETRKRIDELNKEKFTLESEIRKLELEVGPIRYIAELVYGVEEDATKNIASAVRIFTLLITLTLDPLAVTLLIAANYTLLRIRNEKEKNKIPPGGQTLGSATTTVAGVHAAEASNQVADQLPRTAAEESTVETSEVEQSKQVAVATTIPVSEIPLPEIVESMGILNEDQSKILDRERDQVWRDIPISSQVEESRSDDLGGHTEGSLRVESGVEHSSEVNTEDREEEPQKEVADEDVLYKFFGTGKILPVSAGARAPFPTQVAILPEVEDVTTEPRHPWTHQEPILRELIGSEPHFVPKKVITPPVVDNTTQPEANKDKYPRALSWLNEFKGK